MLLHNFAGPVLFCSDETYEACEFIGSGFLALLTVVGVGFISLLLGLAFIIWGLVKRKKLQKKFGKLKNAPNSWSVWLLIGIGITLCLPGLLILLAFILLNL